LVLCTPLRLRGVKNTCFFSSPKSSQVSSVTDVIFYLGSNVHSVSRSDTDTVQVTGVGFDAVIACRRTREVFLEWGWGAIDVFFALKPRGFKLT